MTDRSVLAGQGLFGLVVSKLGDIYSICPYSTLQCSIVVVVLIVFG